MQYLMPILDIQSVSTRSSVYMAVVFFTFAVDEFPNN